MNRTTFVVLAVALAGLLGCRASAPVVIDDHFDDSDPLTNTRGIGHGWYRGGRATTAEADSTLRFSATEFANAWFATKEADNFPFWNDEGATVTWRIKKTDMQTPHRSNAFIVWYSLEIVSAKLKNSVTNVNSVKGGMVIQVGFRDDHSDPLCNVVFGNKTLDTANEEAVENDVKKFRCALPGYRPGMPLVARARVSKDRWAVTFDRPTTGTLSGNWTSDLGEKAAITDEFSTGAFIVVFWRSGSGGQPQPYPANAGELERVTVALGESRR